MTRQQLLDLAERVGVTAAEAGLSVLITQLSGIPTWWAVALMPVLAAAKGALAQWATGTPSLVRRRPTPAAPPVA